MEFIKKLWKENRSRGPDVEEVLLIPLYVAVEDKRTARNALDHIAQIIRYAESGKYDAVIVRLEETPEMDQAFKSLVSLVRGYGIGIVAGGSPYSPLSGLEEILLKARISLRDNPALELSGLRSIKVQVQSEEDLIIHVLPFRRFLFGGNHGA